MHAMHWLRCAREMPSRTLPSAPSTLFPQNPQMIGIVTWYCYSMSNLRLLAKNRQCISSTYEYPIQVRFLPCDLGQTDELGMLNDPCGILE